MLQLPDALVLGGGGTLGEAWMMGVLSGIEDASGLDMRRCEYYVGTSAGSIVAAYLVAGRSPRRPDPLPDPAEEPRAPERPDESVSWIESAGADVARAAGSLGTAAAGTLAPLALEIAAPGGALVRAALLRRLPHAEQTLDGLHEHVEKRGARFDGRLRVTAVDRRSGRRVVFGSPGGPRASVADAVTASCSVPWLFAPVEINGRDYVDGGVWSPTNLDAAPVGRGADVLCLNPTASLEGSNNLIGAFRTASRAAAAAEALALRGRGATVRTFGPDEVTAREMGVDLMNRARAKDVLAAGYRQGLELGTDGGID
jgi:NTE family protein